MSSSLKSRRNRLLIVLSAIMLSVSVAAGFIQMELAEKRAESITVEHGELLLRQTSLLANPLLLSNDRVSLNYLLNELSTLPYIRAAELKTNREGVIARAGNSGGIEMQQALSNKQNSHLSIWLDSTPFITPLLDQLKLTLALFSAAIALALFATHRILHQQPGHNRRQDDARDEPQLSTINTATHPQDAAALTATTLLTNEQDTDRETPQPVAPEQAPESDTSQAADTLENPAHTSDPTPVPTSVDISPAQAEADTATNTPELVPETPVTIEVQDTPDVIIAAPAAALIGPISHPEHRAVAADTSHTTDIKETPAAETESKATNETLPERINTDNGLSIQIPPVELDDIPFIAELSSENGPMTPDDVLRSLDAQRDSTANHQPQAEGDLQAFISSIATPHSNEPDQSEPEPTTAQAPIQRPDLPADIPYIGKARNTTEEIAASSETPELRQEPTFDTNSLVSLLRPDQHERTVPAFQPGAPGPEPEHSHTEDDSDILPELEETRVSRHQQPGFADYIANSLQASTPEKPSNNDEEQLNLYTMEHELELMLNAEDAGYCLYIDTSAHAGNVEESERQQLLRLYTRLAGQTAALYNGNIAELNNGDVLIRFDRALPDDSHGTNALCAAVLFNLLYKGFNQSRIRAFQPALNLRMALARGSRVKEQLLMEEARFLTHTTQSNDLISHTALTEVPILRDKLLQQADIRRQDEDKVLILSLSDNIQELLNKQAIQLLRSP